MEPHETHEKITEARHGMLSERSKRIAILIAVLAAFLAIAETGAKSAQNAYTASNIEAANLWAFFQAKTIRMTTLRTDAELLETLLSGAGPVDRNRATKQIAQWRSTAERYDSEPSTQEGRKELTARTRAIETKRDYHLAAYHLFEYGAAAFQLAIVLASAAVITEVLWLAALAGGLGLIGVALGTLAWFAPTLIHI